MKKVAFLLLIVIFIFSIRCSTGKEVYPDNSDLKINDIIINAEVVYKESDTRTGLMFRKSLAENDGMLFIFPDSRVRGFWMKNVAVPLSIAFIDSNHNIILIDDMEPFDESSHSSIKPCMYALEVNKGFFQKNNIKANDNIIGIPEK